VEDGKQGLTIAALSKFIRSKRACISTVNKQKHALAQYAKLITHNKVNKWDFRTDKRLALNGPGAAYVINPLADRIAPVSRVPRSGAALEPGLITTRQSPFLLGSSLYRPEMACGDVDVSVENWTNNLELIFGAKQKPFLKKNI